MKKSLCLACCGLIVGMAVAQVDFIKGARVSAQASDGQKKCDYTYIADNQAPNIGKDGEIKYNEPWKSVIESGWTLKTAAGMGSTGVYLFEKCR